MTFTRVQKVDKIQWNLRAISHFLEILKQLNLVCNFLACKNDSEVELSLRFYILLVSFQGKSRSGTVVCAYIMAKGKLNMADALELVRGRRRMVDPNPNFCKMLLTFERSCMLEQLREKLS